MQSSKHSELVTKLCPIEKKKRILPHIRIAEFNESQFDSFSPLLLPEGEVQLWQVFARTLESRVKELGTFLSGEEIRRVERFYFQKDQRRFVVAHGVLRMLIGRYLNHSPRLVNFRNGSNGKPELDGHPSLVHFSFNLSHSHNLVLFAFSKFSNLGVDLEHIRPIRDFQQIVNYYFHHNERAAFQSSPLCKRQEKFFDCWTRKEAFVKATGEGLSRPLNSFSTSIGSEKEGSIFDIDGDGIKAANWNLLSFRPAQGYVGAVAFKV